MTLLWQEKEGTISLLPGRSRNSVSHLASLDTQRDGALCSCWVVMGVLTPSSVARMPLSSSPRGPYWRYWVGEVALLESVMKVPTLPRSLHYHSPGEREGQRQGSLITAWWGWVAWLCRWPSLTPSFQKCWDALLQPCEDGHLAPLLWLYWHSGGGATMFLWCLVGVNCYWLNDLLLSRESNLLLGLFGGGLCLLLFLGCWLL